MDIKIRKHFSLALQTMIPLKRLINRDNQQEVDPAESYLIQSGKRRQRSNLHKDYKNRNSL